MTAGQAVIRFYRPVDPWGELSNFAPYPLAMEGLVWPTSEHWFQAQKFPGSPHAERIRQAATPMDAAHLGRDRSQRMRPDWHTVRDQVMKQALVAKFSQHQHCRDVLLSTADAWLIEHTRNDSYWGDGGHGRGQNRLGLLLMEVRAELRAQDVSDVR